MDSRDQKRDSHVMVNLENTYGNSLTKSYTLSEDIRPSTNTFSRSSVITNETDREYARPYYAVYDKPKSKSFKKRRNRQWLIMTWTIVLVVISLTSFGAG